MLPSRTMCSMTAKKARRKVSVTTLTPHLPKNGFVHPSPRRGVTLPSESSFGSSDMSLQTSTSSDLNTRRWSSPHKAEPYLLKKPLPVEPTWLLAYESYEPWTPEFTIETDSLPLDEPLQTETSLPTLPDLYHGEPFNSALILAESSDIISGAIIPTMLKHVFVEPLRPDPALIEPVKMPSIDFWCRAEFYAKRVFELLLDELERETLEASSAGFEMLRGGRLHTSDSGRIMTLYTNVDQHQECLQRISNAFSCEVEYEEGEEINPFEPVTASSSSSSYSQSEFVSSLLERGRFTGSPDNSLDCISSQACDLNRPLPPLPNHCELDQSEAHSPSPNNPLPRSWSIKVTPALQRKENFGARPFLKERKFRSTGESIKDITSPFRKPLRPIYNLDRAL